MAGAGDSRHAGIERFVQHYAGIPSGARRQQTSQADRQQTGYRQAQHSGACVRAHTSAPQLVLEARGILRAKFRGGPFCQVHRYSSQQVIPPNRSLCCH